MKEKADQGPFQQRSKTWGSRLRDTDLAAPASSAEERIGWQKTPALEKYDSRDNVNAAGLGSPSPDELRGEIEHSTTGL